MKFFEERKSTKNYDRINNIKNQETVFLSPQLDSIKQVDFISTQDQASYGVFFDLAFGMERREPKKNKSVFTQFSLTHFDIKGSKIEFQSPYIRIDAVSLSFYLDTLDKVKVVYNKKNPKEYIIFLDELMSKL